MHRLKTIFMGTPAFAVPSLAALAASERVTLAVTNPDRPVGRGRQLSVPPVKAEAERLGIPVFQPEKARNPDAVARFAAAEPDLIVVAAYGHILPKSVLDIPRLGCINVHASILPKYRGAAPINWAIARGETVTGVTIMKMDPGMDTGPMLHVREMQIQEDDTADTVTERLAAVGAQALIEVLVMLRAGRLVEMPQDDARATMAPMLKKEDGRIDWSRPAREIRNLVRGMTPWPSAVTTHGDRVLKVLSAAVREDSSGVAPGGIVAVDRTGIVVACGVGALLLGMVHPDGGKAMTSAAYALGRKVGPGDRLGS